MVALSPDNIFSAPTFFPLVGHPYLGRPFNMEQEENIQQQTRAINIFFIVLMILSQNADADFFKLNSKTV